jgi:hypothetical protein
MFFFLQIFTNSFNLKGTTPPTKTNITILKVCLLAFKVLIISSQSKHRVVLDTFPQITELPVFVIAQLVATMVKGVVSTEFCEEDIASFKAIIKELVHEFVQTTLSCLNQVFNAFVNFTTLGPSPIIPESNTFPTSFFAVVDIATLNIGIVFVLDIITPFLCTKLQRCDY